MSKRIGIDGQPEPVGSAAFASFFDEKQSSEKIVLAPKEQMAFILNCYSTLNHRNEVIITTNADDLNQLLADGWRMVRETPMGGGGGTTWFCSVITLERDA